MSWHRLDFGKDLRAIRLDRKLSLRETANLTGIHFTTISRIERGIGIPQIDKVAALAEWAGLSIDYYRKEDAALGITEDTK